MHLRIAHFIRHYGHDTYRNPYWPTADHIIPFKRFYVLYEAINATKAWEKLNAVSAHALGQAMTNGSKETAVKVQMQLDDLIDEIHGIEK